MYRNIMYGCGWWGNKDVGEDNQVLTQRSKKDIVPDKKRVVDVGGALHARENLKLGLRCEL